MAGAPSSGAPAHQHASSRTAPSSCINVFEDTALLSIIVISRNQIKTIDLCLDSILAATKESGLDQYEIVFVDSQSTDGTPERVRERLGDKVTIVRVTGHLGAAIARNAGAAVAKGDAFFFIDGDMEIGADFLKVALGPDGKLVHPVISGQLPEKFYDEQGNFLTNGPDRYKVRQDEFRSELGGISMISREAFEKVGGFRPELRVNEDVDMGLRLHAAGYKIRAFARVMATHHTVDYFKWSRLSKALIDGSMCFQGVIFRRHWFNPGYWPILISHQRPTAVFWVSLMGGLIFSPWWFLLYLGYVVAKNMRRPGTSLLQDLAGTTARSSGFLIGIPFFYPQQIPESQISFEVVPYPEPRKPGAAPVAPASQKAA